MRSRSHNSLHSLYWVNNNYFSPYLAWWHFIYRTAAKHTTEWNKKAHLDRILTFNSRTHNENDVYSLPRVAPNCTFRLRSTSDIAQRNSFPSAHKPNVLEMPKHPHTRKDVERARTHSQIEQSGEIFIETMEMMKDSIS